MCVQMQRGSSVPRPPSRASSSGSVNGLEMTNVVLNDSSSSPPPLQTGQQLQHQLAATSILHCGERKQLLRTFNYGVVLMLYLAATVSLPLMLAKPLAANFGLVPSANLVFVAPLWIGGIFLWRTTGDCWTASFFAFGWLVSAFASFALGWAIMQLHAFVLRGISVTEWETHGVADGYYFTDGCAGARLMLSPPPAPCMHDASAHLRHHAPRVEPRVAVVLSGRHSASRRGARPPVS